MLSRTRRLAASVPGQNGDLDFEGDAITPRHRPTESHPGIAGYVAQDSWPSWFRDAVRAASNADRRHEEAIA